MKFRTMYSSEKKVESFDKLSKKHHPLYDGLCPLSVKEQVERFTLSGELLLQTRRKELASLRCFDDSSSPDDFESPLDKEHITPGDVLYAQKVYSSSIKKKNESKKVLKDDSIHLKESKKVLKDDSIHLKESDKILDGVSTNNNPKDSSVVDGEIKK